MAPDAAGDPSEAPSGSGRATSGQPTGPGGSAGDASEARPGLGDPGRLGGLDRPDLAAALRPLLEDAGLLIDRLAGRLFASWDAVLDAAEVEVAAMDDVERATLLQAHPRIGERADTLAARSAVSLAEQGGGAPVAPTVQARLAELNSAYEARFGFPFVEFVAGRPPAAIIPVLERRLARARDAELQAGCEALLAIARDRLHHRFAVSTDPSTVC